MLTSTLAGQKAKRGSRKRRTHPTAPRAVPSTRREQRAEHKLVADRDRRRGQRRLGREGERPPSPFGGLPISELAILAGFIAAVVGVVQGGEAAAIVGVRSEEHT